MVPGIPLAIVLFGAVAVVALWAAAKRPRPQGMLVIEPSPVTATADESQPRLAGRPAGAVAQMQHVFHELHADGRHALCAVCDGQYRSA